MTMAQTGPGAQASPGLSAGSQQGQTLRRIVMVLSSMAVVMAMIEFSLFWYWPPSDVLGAINSRPLAGPFRYLALLVFLCCFLGTFALGRFAQLKRILAILAPLLGFIVFGIASILWSIEKVASAKYLIWWLLVFGGLAAASSMLSPERMRQLLTRIFVVFVGSSFLAYLLLPDVGIGYHYGNPVVKGFFVHKNTFGYFACLGAVSMTALGQHKSRKGLVVLGLMWAGVIGSGSATAFAMVATGTSFVLLLRLVAPHRRAHLPVVVLILSVLAIAVLAFIFARGPLADLVGRDITLSGRTSLWAGYLNAFGDRIVLGQGAGLFSSLSERGAAIAGALPGSYGGIGQPHNLYIAILGEVGIVGLLLFVGGHLWIVLVSPFRNNSEWAVLAAGMSMIILIRAMAEDNDGYLPSVAFIIVTLARGQIALGAGQLLSKRQRYLRDRKAQANA